MKQSKRSLWWIIPSAVLAAALLTVGGWFLLKEQNREDPTDLPSGGTVETDGASDQEGSETIGSAASKQGGAVSDQKGDDKEPAGDAAQTPANPEGDDPETPEASDPVSDPDEKDDPSSDQNITVDAHRVKSVTVSYPSDWYTYDQGVTTFLKSRNTGESYLAFYRETPTENDLTYFEDWYPDATIETKTIQGQEWMLVTTTKGTTVTTQMIAIKNGWCYNVEVVIKDGVGEDAIREIMNSVTLP